MDYSCQSIPHGCGPHNSITHRGWGWLVIHISPMYVRHSGIITASPPANLSHCNKAVGTIQKGILMQRSIISRAVAIAALSVASTAWAQMGVEAHRPGEPGVDTPRNVTTPEDTSTTNKPGYTAGNMPGNMPGHMNSNKAMSPDEVDARLSSMDQIHFNQALNNLQANDRDRAAQEIEIVSQYLGMIKDSGKASVSIDGVWSLDDTVSKLNTLASDVRDGKAGASDLRKTFANTSLAIAAAQQNMAKDSLARDKQVMAGYCLRMSAGAFQHAIAWSGQTPDASAREAVSSAQQSGRALVSTPGEGHLAAGAQNPMKSDEVSSNSADNNMDQSAQTAGARQNVPAEQTQQAVRQLGDQIGSFAGKIKNQQNWPGNDAAGSSSTGNMKGDNTNSNDRMHPTPPDSNAFGR